MVRTIYDPTAGTGGFSRGMEYLHELNPAARLATFGQELNPESFAICKADMLIKGQDISNIKLGNTPPTTSCRWRSSTTASPTRHSGWTGRRSRSKSGTNTC